MDDATEQSGEGIAELARKMTPERRGRFLDAACGGDLALRADVEARLNAADRAAFSTTSEERTAESQPQVQESGTDLFESVVLEAVSAEPSREVSLADESSQDQSILAYAREQGLDPVARLRLFQEVCRLLDSAHRRGAIHGGITPELILVGPEGQPRIRNSTEMVAAPAEMDAARLRYASPEQILGEPVTTATDVYALGVILYELLTGRYPYQTASREPGRDELVEAISQQAPERPSRAVERSEGGNLDIPEAGAVNDRKLTALRKQLESDLELIVLRAMQKEPERRYRSALALAEDIDRFREGRPVLAHQPGKLYLAGKFVRRHPVLTALCSVALIGLVSGLVGTSLSLARARRDLDRASRSSRMAQATLDELFSSINHEHALSAPDLTQLRKGMLESFLRHYEQAGEQSGDAAPTRLEVARTRERTGRIYEMMGLGEVAAWQYRAALEAFEELEGESPASTRFVEERVGLMSRLGRLLSVRRDQHAEARGYLEQAQRLLRDRPSSSKATSGDRRALAGVLSQLAELERFEGHQEQAAALWRQTISINRELASGSAATDDDRVFLTESLVGLGRVLLANPKTAGPGLEDFIKGVELRQAIVNATPSWVEQSVALGGDFRELSALYQTSGQIRLAVENARRAVDVFEQLDRRFPDTLTYQTDLYLAEDALSRLLGVTNETAVALEHASRVRTILEQLVARHPRNRSFAFDLSRCHNLIGRLLQRRKAYPEALRSFQRAVDMLESMGQLDGERSYQLATSLALCVSLLGAGAETPPPDDETTLSPADQLRRQVYGKRAVAALSQAVTGGIANDELYRTDPDLDSLRDRSDFQKLLRQVIETSKADAPGT